MLQVLAVAALCSLAAAHGHVKEYVIDGNTYPSFDPAFDYGADYASKRIEWGFAKGKGAVGPVESVVGPDITCRFKPLQAPGVEAVARAGSNIDFVWLDWFTSHKGPVITWMAPLPASGKVEDAEFFKISEDAYDPATNSWGTDRLIANKQTNTATIPSDLKAGTYIVRHEIISLHNSLNDDYVKKSSGAQFYPQCIKVKVVGDGTATPEPAGKFPGLYQWDDKGILVNIFYRAREYFPPGPAVYKSTAPAGPTGEKPTVDPSILSSSAPKSYVQNRAKADSRWISGVHSTDRGHPGGGGCLWEVGADPATAKCTDMNPADKRYAGFAQPPQSPAYVDQAHMDRSIVKYGPVIKYLFDPTKPRMEERVKAGKQ